VAYQPRDLYCGDCRQSFLFSVEQQGLCVELGFDQPARCPGCRRRLENSRRTATSVAYPRLSAASR
jgi:hypothetical protein